MAQPNSSDTTWDTFRRHLQGRIPQAALQTWIDPLDTEIDGNVLRLVAPTDFHYRWVRDRYLAAIADAAEGLFGEEVTVDLVAALREPSDVADAPTPRISRPLGTSPGDQREPQQRTVRLIPKYTFDNFVVGQSNRFAHAAALAVAEQPGSQYNPLFIYADAGLGKTHLLHAVGHHRLEIDPTATIRYVTSEQFFNEFINGIRRKRMDQFKDRYRHTDLLLLDDVQFFEGKEQILEEFFHTFNTLYEHGKQLVISSDRHPRNLSTLEDRLRSRFEWGLLTDIQTPDVETRLAILRKNAEFAPTPVPRDVLNYIADNVFENVRELEGALTRVTAFAALTHERITLPMAKEVLRDVIRSPRDEPITADLVIDATSRYFDLPRADLLGPSRKQPLARARQIAMYLCRELTDLSLPKIGAAFGGRDHTTVMHAVDKIKGLMERDKEVFDAVSNLSGRLRTT